MRGLTWHHGHRSSWSSPQFPSVQDGDHHARPAADMLDHKSFSLMQNAQAMLAPGFDQGQVRGAVPGYAAIIGRAVGCLRRLLISIYFIAQVPGSTSQGS